MPPPLYRKVAQSLREQITSGELRPGDKLPTERQLVEQFSVSRDTIRLATAQLLNEGLIYRVPGRSGGMVVRDKLRLTFHASYAEQPGAPRSESDSWHADVAAQGLTPTHRFECRTVKLADEIAQWLGEPEDAPAVLRRCIRSVNGHPSSIQDTYYPMWLATDVPELLSPDDIPIGTTRLLAERGVVQVGYLDTVTARMPTPEEVTLLELVPGTPVLVKIRTGCTAERIVRVTVEVMVGDANAVEYEVGQVGPIREGDDE